MRKKFYITSIVIFCIICSVILFFSWTIKNRNPIIPEPEYITVNNWETQYTSEEHIERINKIVFNSVENITVYYLLNNDIKTGNFKIKDCETHILYAFDETPSYFVVDLKYVIDGVNEESENYFEWETYTIGYVLSDKYYYGGWAHDESSMITKSFSSPYKIMNVFDKKIYYGYVGLYVYEEKGVLYDTQFNLANELIEVTELGYSKKLWMTQMGKQRNKSWKLLG